MGSEMCIRDRPFLPVTYGYAMTMRKAQGSTLDIVVLWFDHCYPADRGYGYVGASRVREARLLALMGKVRRTDWLPVGENEGEQLRRGSDSEDTPSGSDINSDEPSDSEDLESEPDDVCSLCLESEEDEAAYDFQFAAEDEVVEICDNPFSP